MLPEFKSKEAAAKKKPAKVNYEIPDFSNEPFFIKKAEEARKTLAKYGLPKVKPAKK